MSIVMTGRPPHEYRTATALVTRFRSAVEEPVASSQSVEYHDTGRGEIQHGPVEALYIASVPILHGRAEFAVEIFDTSPPRPAPNLP